jgi:hypothetical protein
MEKRGRAEIDTNEIRVFSFNTLRDLVITDEKGMFEPNAAIATGRNTRAFRLAMISFLNNGPCKSTSNIPSDFTADARTMNILKNPSTLFYFSRAPNNQEEVFDYFLAVADIFKKNNSMYINHFCAKKGGGGTMIRYILNERYGNESYWTLDSIQSAKGFWEHFGFQEDKEIIEKDEMETKRKNETSKKPIVPITRGLIPMFMRRTPTTTTLVTKKRNVKRLADCYSCEKVKGRYLDPLSNLMFCSYDCHDFFVKYAYHNH